MSSVLISGAASGLGFCFLQTYARLPAMTIFAIDQSPIFTKDLELHESSTVEFFVVDVSSTASIANLVLELGERPLNLIIHSAGIRGLVPAVESQFPNDVAAAETLDVMDFDTLVRTYQVNAVGTFLLLRAMLPNLKLCSEPHSPSKVIVMGSRMGSMSANTGSGYAYRASKAATNSIVKSFSVDVPEIVFSIIHPGRVETGLVQCREAGAIEVQESISTILEVISNVSMENSGCFFDRFGQKIEW